MVVRHEIENEIPKYVFRNSNEEVSKSNVPVMKKIYKGTLRRTGENTSALKDSEMYREDTTWSCETNDKSF